MKCCGACAAVVRRLVAAPIEEKSGPGAISGKFRCAICWGGFDVEVEHPHLLNITATGDELVELIAAARLEIGVAVGCDACHQETETAAGRAVKSSIVFHNCGRGNYGGKDVAAPEPQAPPKPEMTIVCFKHGKACPACRGTGLLYLPDPKDPKRHVLVKPERPCRECNGRARDRVPWDGHVLCRACTRIYAAEVSPEGKFIYPSTNNGFCECGSALLPSAAISRGVFSGKAVCLECVDEALAKAAP